LQIGIVLCVGQLRAMQIGAAAAAAVLSVAESALGLE